jgi:hypothetical protein
MLLTLSQNRLVSLGFISPISVNNFFNQTTSLVFYIKVRYLASSEDRTTIDSLLPHQDIREFPISKITTTQPSKFYIPNPINVHKNL